MALYWTDEQADLALFTRGYIVCIGQVSPAQRRRLDKEVGAGRLAKWRARWNAPLGGYGIGPLKTIYGELDLQPEQMEAA